jgi:hypothetical protein
MNMRAILTLIGAATVTFLGAGWYLGWYDLKRSGETGNISVDINSDKVTKDIKKGAQRVGDVVDKIRDGSDSKPPALTTPSQSSSGFFTPSGSSGGWKPVEPTPGAAKPNAKDDAGYFGIQIPKR